MFIVGCSHQQHTISVPVSSSPTGGANSRDLARQLLVEVNDYRRTKGRKPLVPHSGLDGLASEHARYLLSRRGSFSLHGRTVSHYGFDGRSALARARFGFDGVSENIASTPGGTANAPRIFRSLWVKSRSHEHNMLSNYEFTGIGVAIGDDGTVVAVQMFGTRGMQSHHQMIDRFRNF